MKSAHFLSITCSLLLPICGGVTSLGAQSVPHGEIIDLETMEVKGSALQDAHPGFETFDLRSERQIDILFVVDNSNSMKEEQTQLASAFEHFIHAFSRRSLDFRIGILTTEALDGSLTANRKWPQPYLTPTTVNLTIEFQDAIQVGIRGSKAETAFRPIIAAMKNPASAVFFRPEAFLYIVIVSDEDESKGTGWRSDRYLIDDEAALLERLTILQTDLLSLKNMRRGMIRLDAVTAPDPIPTDCQTRIAGRAFSRAASQMRGKTIPICSDFSGELISIADEVSTVAQRRFALRYPAITSTINVSIDSKPIPMDAENGFSYELEANAINLHGEALRASFGSVVAVDYKWLPTPESPVEAIGETPAE